MGMKLEVYCGNCKEHILEADTDTLEQPLTGAMFKVRPEREWYLSFDNECEGINLTCPVCGWMFHVEQSLLVRKAPRRCHSLHIADADMVNQKMVFEPDNKGMVAMMITGKPKKLVKLFAPPPEPEPELVAVESEPDTPMKIEEPKPRKKRGFFKDTRSY